MPYDEYLADRIRQAISAIPGVTEQFKFGGPSFMLNDVVFMRAHHNGQIMQRCKYERTEELVQKDGVKRLVMKGKRLDGWLLVDVTAADTEDDLQFWIDVALEGGRNAKPAKKKIKKS